MKPLVSDKIYKALAYFEHAGGYGHMLNSSNVDPLIDFLEYNKLLSSSPDPDDLSSPYKYYRLSNDGSSELKSFRLRLVLRLWAVGSAAVLAPCALFNLPSRLQELLHLSDDIYNLLLSLSAFVDVCIVFLFAACMFRFFEFKRERPSDSACSTISVLSAIGVGAVGFLFAYLIR